MVISFVQSEFGRQQGGPHIAVVVSQALPGVRELFESFVPALAPLALRNVLRIAARVLLGNHQNNCAPTAPDVRFASAGFQGR